MPTTFTVFDPRPASPTHERTYQLDWGMDEATVECILDDLAEMKDADGNIHMMLVVGRSDVMTKDGIWAAIKSFRKIFSMSGRYAVVGNLNPLALAEAATAKLFGLTVHVFAQDEVDKARAWVRQPLPTAAPQS